MKTGAFINWKAWWMGIHWSPYNKRFCINLLPCCTIWIVKEGGNIPARCKEKTLSSPRKGKVNIITNCGKVNIDNHGAMSI